MNRFNRIILTPVKGLIGLGFSKCECCRFPFNLVDSHTIYVDNCRGVFAVCEDCWNTKSDEEIIDAYNKVYDSWLQGDWYNKPLTERQIGFTRAEMLSALSKALNARKEE